MPIEFLLMALLLAIAVVITRIEDLFAAAMLFSIFSLLSAGLFTLMDAVDVAFTEAAVGAGISTVLILGTLALTSEREYQSEFKPMPVIVVLITGAALIYGTEDMPYYGDPHAPIHNEVTEGFIEGTKKDVGMPNIVTAVLASYRGYDTYGETMVVFTAGIGVILLLGGPKREPDDVEVDG